jgi:hypothetical protein
VNIRVLAYIVASAAGLSAQYHGAHHFSWQEACFKNPAAPYCDGHDFAIKPTKPAKDGAHPSAGTSSDPLPSTTESPTPSVIVEGAIDWRFADPLADTLARLKFSQLSASPFALNLMAQLAAGEGISQAEMRKIFERLSGVDQVALSVRDDRIVLMIAGRTTDSTLPAPEAGWKAVPVRGNALLVGNSEAVDQAVERIATQGPPAELARSAEQLQDSDFFAIGSARTAGPEAVSAGVKRFQLTASMRDRLISDAAFEFNGVPDAKTLQMWPATFGGAMIDGNVVHQRISMEADEVQQKSGQIASSALGRRLRDLAKAVQHLPALDNKVTGHTKPVIYGLDDGPKEVSQPPNR